MILGYTKPFYIEHLKAQVTELKIDKLAYIKILNVCVSKYTIKKVKMHCEEWEKIFTKQISDKVLISRTHKALLQFNFLKGK